MATVACPILLIDFSALFRRAWHVETQQSVAYEATIAGVNRASGMLPDALVAICCDGRGNWRKELSKEYKAHREQQPAQMFGEMDRTLDRLRKDGRLIWKFDKTEEHDGFEADDVIATAVKHATVRGHWCRIASHDKDLLQLLSPACDFLAIHKTPWEVVKHHVVVDKYGVEAGQFRDWLALVGDSSDNVKGCPGVGPKTATELLQRFNDIDGIYLSLSEHLTMGTPAIASPNVMKKLEEHQSDVVTARRLVSLRTDVPLKFDEIYETREIASIDERDHMSEAEKDADKYFSSNDSTQKEKPADPSPETVKAGRTEETETAPEGIAVPTNIQQAPSPPDVVIAEKKQSALDVALQTTEPREIAVVEYSRQLEPRSFRETVIAATVYKSSRVYSRYPTAESMAAAIVRGRELGLGMGAALDAFHVADFNRDGNLRLMMHAHLIIDLAMNHPTIEYFYLDHSDDKSATYVAKVKRNPKPTPHTYTIEQATKANLVRLTQSGKPNLWMMRPNEQLRKTCGVQLARIVCPGAALGLYCPEEMGVDE